MLTMDPCTPLGVSLKARSSWKSKVRSSNSLPARGMEPGARWSILGIHGRVGMLGIGTDCKCGWVNTANHRVRKAGHVRCKSKISCCNWYPVCLQKSLNTVCAHWENRASFVHSSKIQAGPKWWLARKVPVNDLDLSSCCSLLSPRELKGWHEIPALSNWAWAAASAMSRMTLLLLMSPWTTFWEISAFRSNQAQYLGFMSLNTWVEIPHACNPVAPAPMPEQISIAFSGMDKFGGGLLITSVWLPCSSHKWLLMCLRTPSKIENSPAWKSKPMVVEKICWWITDWHTVMPGFLSRTLALMDTDVSFAMAASKGSTWKTAMWPNPGGKTPVPKLLLAPVHHWKVLLGRHLNNMYTCRMFCSLNKIHKHAVYGTIC